MGSLELSPVETMLVELAAREQARLLGERDRLLRDAEAATRAARAAEEAGERVAQDVIATIGAEHGLAGAANARLTRTSAGGLHLEWDAAAAQAVTDPQEAAGLPRLRQVRAAEPPRTGPAREASSG